MFDLNNIYSSEDQNALRLDNTFPKFLRVISEIDVRKAINSQSRGVGVASRREVEKLRKLPAKLASPPHV